MQRLPPQMGSPGSMPSQGPTLKPRSGPLRVTVAPGGRLAQNAPGRNVGRMVPQAVSLQRGASRGSPFRQTSGGGGISLGAFFNDTQQAPQPPGSYRCIGRPDPATGQNRPCVSGGQNGLGIPLTMGIDDYKMTGGVGPMCEGCWADAWVYHNLQNNPNMPQCKFGVQWTEAEWGTMQLAIQGAIQDFMSPVDPKGRPRLDAYNRPYQPRYPTPEEMSQVLQSFKWSRDCPRCAKLLKGAKVPVAFTPDVNDFRIAGVNA